jgi:hypothetical protein
MAHVAGAYKDVSMPAEDNSGWNKYREITVSTANDLIEPVQNKTLGEYDGLYQSTIVLFDRRGVSNGV